MSGDNYKTYLGETESRFRIRSSEFENFKKTETLSLVNFDGRPGVLYRL